MDGAGAVGRAATQAGQRVRLVRGVVRDAAPLAVLMALGQGHDQLGLPLLSHVQPLARRVIGVIGLVMPHQ